MGVVRKLVLGFLFLPLPVLAQDWEFGEAAKLASSVNSPYEEGLPLISPDGNTLFFTRSFSPANKGGQYTGSDIWISRYDPVAGLWKPATNDEFSYNNKGSNAVIGLSDKGDGLYWVNSFPTKPVKGFYFSKKTDNQWGEPEFIPVDGVQTNEYIGLYVSPDCTVLILSLKGSDSRGEEDLYISVRDSRGQWSPPKNLGPTINSTGFEISPFLSPDKKKLFFSSNGHSGFGDADIFYSERLYDSWETWSVPRNMGPKVNSPDFDAYFSIYGDTVGYFSSNRGGDLSDIYRIKTERKSRGPEEIQRDYLSSEDVNRLAGQNVSQSLFFDENISELTNEQIRQLNVVGAIFASKHDIKLHLMAHRNPDVSLEIYQQRLINILNQLKNGGIPGSRITFGVEIDATVTLSEKGKIEMLFYK